MRVISGEARGRRLKELTGLETRPTTDKVKESIFNIIQFDIEGRRVLDLFGGTGQLGIECLSRGAAGCTFVDVRKEAAALIRDNLALCGFTDRARVVQGDYLAFLTGCRPAGGALLPDRRGHRPAGEAGKAVSPRVLRRHAAAGGHRHCHRLPAQDPHL